jgi:N-methylhydantoinase B/oxoprolinase/acetone carboxylase alpha subunit
VKVTTATPAGWWRKTDLKAPGLTWLAPSCPATAGSRVSSSARSGVGRSFWLVTEEVTLGEQRRLVKDSTGAAGDAGAGHDDAAASERR